MEKQYLDKYKRAVRKNRVGLISSGGIFLLGLYINNQISFTIGYRVDWIFYIIGFIVLMYFACVQLKCPNCHEIIDARVATKIDRCPYCGVKINERNFNY